MKSYAIAPGLLVLPLDDCRVAFDTATGDTHFIHAINVLVIDLLMKEALSAGEIKSRLQKDFCEVMEEADEVVIETFLTNASQAGILANQ